MNDMDNRARVILAHVVDAYCKTAEPVGSRYLADHYGLSLSSATIRNVLSDLEQAGLLYSPHTSAGRVPTEQGLRFFVRSVMEVGDILPHERNHIENSLRLDNQDWESTLANVSATLSGISQCAGIVSAPKGQETLKQIYFVRLGSDRALVVLIAESGLVENRIITISQEVSDAMLIQAQNYLSAHLAGKTLEQAKEQILLDVGYMRTELDALSQNLVEKGLEVWSTHLGTQSIIVRGAANLIQDTRLDSNVRDMREILQSLEDKEIAARLLDAAIDAQGVQIFIGSENPLFANSECSVVLAPYRNQTGRVMGAIGVIGPQYMQYNRVVPVINYTAQLMSHIIG